MIDAALCTGKVILGAFVIIGCAAALWAQVMISRRAPDGSWIKNKEGCGKWLGD